MAVSDETDRTKAIHIKHLSHRWLRMLDDLVGAAQLSNGGFFDLFAPFRGHDQPAETDLNMKYRPLKLND